MPDSRRVTNIEKKLGFKWERGLSRTKGESCKIRLVKHLIDDIDDLKQEWVGVLPSQLRKRADFETSCLKLYEKHAPRIWPDPPADRSAWLVDANVNSWDGMYPHDLTVGKHDELLSTLFVTLVYEKCVRYHENQKQQERRSLKNYNDLEPSEVTSPAIEFEDHEIIPLGSYALEYKTGQARRQPATEGVASSATFTLPGLQHQSLGDDRVMAAPVAQMVPNSHQAHPSGSDLGTEIFELSDSDSDDTDDPRPGTSFQVMKSAPPRPPNNTGRDHTVPKSQHNGRKRPIADPGPWIHSSKRRKKRKAFVHSHSTIEASLPAQETSDVLSARSKLELKYRAADSSSPITKPSPAQSTEPSNTGSTIHVSNMRLPGIDRSSEARGREDAQSKARQSVSKDAQQRSSAIPLQSFDGVDGSLRATSSGIHQPAQRACSIGREDMYDVAQSSNEPERQVAAEQRETPMEYQESSVAGHSAESSHETSQPSSSLYNECSVTSNAQKDSMLPIQETAEVQQKPQAADGSQQTRKIGRPAYVEDEAEPTDMPTPKAFASAANDTQCGSASFDTAPSLARIPDLTSQTKTSLQDDDESKREFTADESKVQTEATRCSVDAVGHQPKKQDSPTFKDEAGVPSEEVKISSASSSESLVTSSGRHQSPSVVAGTRKLILRLITAQEDEFQFIVVPITCCIEDLFERVQLRMNDRLDSKVIKHLKLRLPSQPTGERPYRIQRDDPDTWGIFVELAEDEVGQKIKITADVEL